MGEYADMAISDSLYDYIRESDDSRRKSVCEIEDLDGEIMYVNKGTGEILMRDVQIGKEIKSFKCGSCGSTLVIRKNSMSNQYFIGCSSFPKCRKTYSL
jgi:predicted RNA-binding Zn-ribbon protein involved in translation (DUF1610 family)